MAKSKPSKDRPKKKEAKRAAKPAKPAARKPAKPAAKPVAKPKAPEKPSARPSARPATPPARPLAEAKAKPAPEAARAGKPASGPTPDARPVKALKEKRKGSRRPTLLRRGPDGEILAPGDLLLPGGTQRVEEVLYLFRGCAAAEHRGGAEEALAEVFARRPATGEFPGDRNDLQKALDWASERFDHGHLEAAIPQRTKIQRTFQGVVERARHRRREIGAFLRGLDLGRTETGHMDAHGEASLQSLMEWAARLENLAEADEPNQADYGQFHRGLDQLESTTEALILDVEQTLRRLRDRLRS